MKLKTIISLKIETIMRTDDTGDFILAGNEDLMEMVGKKSFQYALPCLEKLQPSQSQDNQEHKILLLLQ